MKKPLLISLTFAIFYTAILCSIAVYRDLVIYGNELPRVWDMEDVLTIIMIALLSAMAFFILICLAKVHMNMNHLGWKRLLFIAFLILIPIETYFGLKIGLISSNIVEQFLMTTSAIGASYASILFPFIIFKWISDGFSGK